jgi:hypothetical protein
MIVTDLSSGETSSISEDRGPLATDCRLDSAVLEELAGSTASTLEAGADFLVVNRFGKREAEGGGFRSALAMAITEGIPAVVAVNRSQIEAWRAFAGSLACELPPEARVIETWIRSALGATNDEAPIAHLPPDAPTP